MQKTALQIAIEEYEKENSKALKIGRATIDALSE